MKIEDEVGVVDPIRHILLHDIKNSYQTLAVTMDMVVDLTLPTATTFFSWKFHSISIPCSKTGNLIFNIPILNFKNIFHEFNTPLPTWIFPPHSPDPTTFQI